MHAVLTHTCIKSSQQLGERGAIILFILQMGKLRFRLGDVSVLPEV